MLLEAGLVAGGFVAGSIVMWLANRGEKTRSEALKAEGAYLKRKYDAALKKLGIGDSDVQA